MNRVARWSCPGAFVRVTAGSVRGTGSGRLHSSPTADPSNQGGERLGLGVNGVLGGGWRLAAEALFPVQQDLDGPQMETDLIWVLGAQLSF